MSEEEQRSFYLSILTQILDTYIDRAMTGTNDNRADFQRMIKDSGKREWDHVIVYKLDRFSRDKYATAVYKKALKDNGVTLLSATECIPSTPEGIIVESLLEGMGQFYSVELSQKVRRGMKESRQKGRFMGAYLIYGYKIANKKVVIDEEKAEVIRYMYEQFAQGVVDNCFSRRARAKQGVSEAENPRVRRLCLRAVGEPLGSSPEK